MQSMQLNLKPGNPNKKQRQNDCDKPGNPNKKRRQNDCDKQCGQCNTSFNSKLLYHRHVREHRNRNKAFCKECVTFLPVKKFVRHQLMYHSDSHNLKYCEECGTWKIASLFDGHKKNHNDKSLAYCNACQYFYRKELHAYHQQQIHTDSKKCTICNVYFNSKQARIYHSKRHENPKLFYCIPCRRFYDIIYRETHKQEHSRNVHAREVQQVEGEVSNPVPAREGKRKSGSYNEFYLHSCKHCEKRFHIKSNLHLHMERKHRSVFSRCRVSIKKIAISIDEEEI